jgi:hypothetical protein
MSELVASAFRALGPRPTPQELEAVAAALLRSGDREALALFDEAAKDLPISFGRVVELAERAGAHAFVALDLLTEVVDAGAKRRVEAAGAA